MRSSSDLTGAVTPWLRMAQGEAANSTERREIRLSRHRLNARKPQERFYFSRYTAQRLAKPPLRAPAPMRQHRCASTAGASTDAPAPMRQHCGRQHRCATTAGASTDAPAPMRQQDFGRVTVAFVNVFDDSIGWHAARSGGHVTKVTKSPRRPVTVPAALSTYVLSKSRGPRSSGRCFLWRQHAKRIARLGRARWAQHLSPSRREAITLVEKGEPTSARAVAPREGPRDHVEVFRAETTGKNDGSYLGRARCGALTLLIKCGRGADSSLG